MRKPAVGIFTDGFSIRYDWEMVIKLCFANGADVVFFTKDDVDFDSETVNAQVWTPDGFVRETVKIPHYVECGPCLHELRKYFSSKAIVVDNFKLSKKDVNDVLNRSKFAPCVIPTMHTYKVGNILSFAMMWNEIIIKPLVGARGEGIYCLKLLSDGTYLFTDTEGNEKKLSHDDSLKELEKLYDNLTVIVQPRMKFLNKDGQIMDFRLNVEKNGEGKWQTIFMIARTSRDKIVSNFSAGGYASLLDVTLAIDYGENAERVKASLEEIAVELPLLIEEESKCNMLSLGIDVGIDSETLQPYIIEVNYVPKLTFPDKSVYINTKADYFTYLSKQINNQK